MKTQKDIEDKFYAGLSSERTKFGVNTTVSMISAFVFLFSAQSFGRPLAMINCSGEGYQMTIFDNGFTYHAEATLKTPDDKIVHMDCAMFTGLPGSSWSCSDDSRAKWEVVVFGNEWERKISAKLSLDTRLIASLTCRAAQ